MEWNKENIIGMIIENELWSKKWYVESVIDEEINLANVDCIEQKCLQYCTLERFIRETITNCYKGKWNKINTENYQIY